MEQKKVSVKTKKVTIEVKKVAMELFSIVKKWQWKFFKKKKKIKKVIYNNLNLC
jgi:hypothetical protein